VAVDKDVLGSVFGAQKAEHIADLGADPRLANSDNAHQRGVTLMVGPLSSANRKLGVLVITAMSAEQTFNLNDFEVFTSLVEQSAFALAHAMTHQEAMSKRQLEKELANASEVQRILLPGSDPSLDGWVIAGRNRAARILSGDFYDYVQPDAKHFGAVIADVSGKGFPAALIAATARSALQAHAQTDLSPASVLAAVNRQVAPNIRGDMFISMIFMVLELGGNGITLARAGHPNPLWFHEQSGTVEEVNSPGLGVGIDDGDVFERVTKNCSITLESGDVLLLYTDGVDEAMNAEGDEFGKERIHVSLAASSQHGAKAVVDQLMESLNAFVGGKASHDDVTVIALQKL
jgi:sigma-B regulation protein RsbU (phosphoserine phosphatase)